jgi:uncharacterized paraquat-inducible protein A
MKYKCTNCVWKGTHKLTIRQMVEVGKYTDTIVCPRCHSQIKRCWQMSNNDLENLITILASILILLILWGIGFGLLR